MKITNYLFSLILLFASLSINSQETLPIYQDYLSDNVYLVHPAAAGIGDCGKIRVTARAQWLDVNNAPALQTASFHTRISKYSNTALGVILFNDRNGFHSQQGIQGTYAYHVSLDQTNRFEQLSFGLSFSGIANQVNQTTFAALDPQVAQVVQSDFYVNADFGVGYHLKGLSSYITVKNVFLTSKENNITSRFNVLDLRNYILGAGYFFGQEDKYQYEPSFMFQYKDQTGEKIADVNFKIYKRLEKSQIWAGLSYRTSFDSNSFDGSQFVSPIIGVNFNKMMLAYTYTRQFDEIVLSNTGFHQISLGFNVLCREPSLSSCPNIKGILF